MQELWIALQNSTLKQQTFFVPHVFKLKTSDWSRQQLSLEVNVQHMEIALLCTSAHIAVLPQFGNVAQESFIVLLAMVMELERELPVLVRIVTLLSHMLSAQVAQTS
jgi:hypothetical protein